MKIENYRLFLVVVWVVFISVFLNDCLAQSLKAEDYFLPDKRFTARSYQHAGPDGIWSFNDFETIHSIKWINNNQAEVTEIFMVDNLRLSIDQNEYIFRGSDVELYNRIERHALLDYRPTTIDVHSAAVLKIPLINGDYQNVEWTEYYKGRRISYKASMAAVMIEGELHEAVRLEVSNGPRFRYDYIEYYVKNIGLWNTYYSKSDKKEYAVSALMMIAVSERSSLNREFNTTGDLIEPLNTSEVHEMWKKEFYPLYVKKLKADSVAKAKALLAEDIERKKREYFLSTRLDTSYNLSEYPSLMNEYRSDLDQDLNAWLLGKEEINHPFSFKVAIRLDTFGIPSHIERNNPEIISDYDEIVECINKVKGPVPKEYDYKVFSMANYSAKFDRSEHQILLKKNENGLELIRGDQSIYYKNKQLLEKELAGFNSGRATLKVVEAKVNKTQSYNADVMSVRTHNGPYNALSSIILPGLGNSGVNNGNGSMFGPRVKPVVTTIMTLGLIASGLILNYSWRGSYELYHLASTQENIDMYYRQANNQRIASFVCLGLGGTFWVSDIAWTTWQGFRNVSRNRSYKRSLNFKN